MTEICFVRHGETDWNKEHRLQGRENIPLNHTGRDQALRTAAVLSREKWDAVISSPLSRAMETAEIITNTLGIDDFLTMRHFQERSLGNISGKLYDEVKRLYKDESAEGMEPLEELLVRMETGLAEVVERFEGKRVIVVSHGLAIRVFLSHTFHREVSPRVKLHNACISHLTYEDGRWMLGEWNIADHLTDITVRA